MYETIEVENDKHQRTAARQKGQKEMYYAIEIIGYGKRTRYTVKRVTASGTVCPTDGKTYRTETDARSAAAAMGCEIAKCGDLWQII